MRFVPCGLLSFKRSAFKKSAGISTNKHAVTCVTRCSRGVCTTIMCQDLYLYLPRLAQNIHELLTRCRAIESLTQLRTAF